MTDAGTSQDRARELELNLAEVRERIAAAAVAARRAPEDVTLVVVTKTWPASDVAVLAALGVTDVAENRDQEARPKHEALAGLGLRWHFVGQLQRNKARSVASYADVVQSVDRPELATALDRAAAEARSDDRRPGAGRPRRPAAAASRRRGPGRRGRPGRPRGGLLVPASGGPHGRRAARRRPGGVLRGPPVRLRARCGWATPARPWCRRACPATWRPRSRQARHTCAWARRCSEAAPALG